MPDKKIRFSLILPAYNERENLPVLMPKIIDVLSKLGNDYEIIIIDDGSTDGTPEIIGSILKQSPKIKYTKHEKNLGLSRALETGYKMASGDIIITMDSDLQYDPKDIPKLIEKLDKYDLVCGYRHMRLDYFIKRFSSKIANYIRNLITDENIKDAGCIFRALRRECLKDIEFFDGFHRFLPTLFKINGYKVIEVEVKHFPRIYGKSKYGIRNRIISTFFDTLKVRQMKLGRERQP